MNGAGHGEAAAAGQPGSSGGMRAVIHQDVEQVAPAPAMGVMDLQVIRQLFRIRDQGLKTSWQPFCNTAPVASRWTKHKVDAGQSL